MYSNKIHRNYKQDKNSYKNICWYISPNDQSRHIKFIKTSSLIDTNNTEPQKSV